MQSDTQKSSLIPQATSQRKKSLTKLSYELTLHQLGGFGRYQIFACAWYTTAVFVIAPYFGYLSFGGATPARKCHETANKTFGSIALNQSENCEFVTQFYSIVNEWQLTGTRRYLNAMATSVQMAGTFIGPIISGQLSDRLGRKITFSACFVLLLVAGTVSAMSNSLTMFIILRFFNGVLITAASSVHFVWYIEFIPENWRLLNNVLGYALGYMYLALLAYLTKDWRKLGLWTNLFAVLVIPMTLILNESPKWLIQRNRLNEAGNVLKRIATWNGVPWRDVDAIVMLNDATELANIRNRAKDRNMEIPNRQQKVTKTYTYWHLFHNRAATIQAIALAFSWATVSCVYFSLTYNVSNFAGNIFLNFCIINAFRSFFNLLTVLADRYIPWFGRQFCNQLGLLSSLACMIIIVICYVVQKDRELESVIAWIAIFGISFGNSRVWVVVEIYVAEIFPTALRNMGYGFCSLCARIGGIIGPQIFLLFYIWKPGPFIIFGAITILNSITSFIFLPETKGKPLPDLPKAG